MGSSRGLPTHLVFFLMALNGLMGCASPTARIQPMVKEFKQTYPANFAELNGPHRQIHYAFSGNPNNPPVIFVHGSPGDWSGWVEFLMNEELQKHFHLIAVDRPGYGGSGEGEAELSLKNQAQDILGVLQFNHSNRPAIVVGHSYGGAVIAQMAVEKPESISELIFVASSVDPKLEDSQWYQFVATWWPFRLMIPTGLRVCNEEIMALKEQLERLEPQWSSITANVVTIQGTGDTLVPAANQDFILSHVRPELVQSVITVEGMNHFVPWQRPELILNELYKLER